MKISKKKTIFTRFVTAMISAFMLQIVFSFSAVSVMATDKTSETVTVAELPITDTEENFNVTPLDAPDRMTFDTYASFEEPQFVILAGGNTGNGNGTASGSSTADTAYNNVINFFITWIRRIGAMVAFVGAVMFGLAIKNNDADQKQNGLLTMVAGFVIFAICLAVDMFDLFS
ncbi:MAG: hypothetical protein K2N27_04000 [Ruminococcus sp.]|nr:hypothetical protein [Ruminococcus sp.]